MPLDVSTPDPIEDTYQKNRTKPAIVIAVILLLTVAIAPLYAYLLPMIEEVQSNYQRVNHILVAPPEIRNVSASFEYDDATRDIIVTFGSTGIPAAWELDRVWYRVEEMPTEEAGDGSMYRVYGTTTNLPLAAVQEDITAFTIKAITVPGGGIPDASLVGKKLSIVFTYRWKSAGTGFDLYRDMRVLSGWFTVPPAQP